VSALSWLQLHKPGSPFHKPNKGQSTLQYHGNQGNSKNTDSANAPQSIEHRKRNPLSCKGIIIVPELEKIRQSRMPNTVWGILFVKCIPQGSPPNSELRHPNYNTP
jgi:hypothetical protein